MLLPAFVSRSPLVKGLCFLALLTAVLAPATARADRPEFPAGLDWINVKSPLTKQDLKGKFVLIDFWTFCCINCIHIMPELKKLEKAYPNELVVIGVHSGKFRGEKGSEDVTEAVLRYELEHPIVNDPNLQVWTLFGADTWPTLILIDPEGNEIWRKKGESKFADVDKELKKGLAIARRKKLLSDKPIRLDPAKSPPTPLRFPGKVLADEASKRLFIADSNNNRLVVATLDGKLLDVVGSGHAGKTDGDFSKASFDKPQGLALKGDLLYVADTENHLIRRVDLNRKAVTTIAGTGTQLPLPFIGTRKARSVAMSSPWDLWLQDKYLYIAMAGLHQIWKLKLEESDIGAHAGNGREDIVDGPLLPRTPGELGFASFAQPSGLACDGTWLYVADSEGSSIRRVPLDPKKRGVETVVGTSELPEQMRLFTFGDVDGNRNVARLQHVLGVVFVKDTLYVADTYNNKIKSVDPQSGEVRTFAGTGKPGHDDAAGTFDEPAGISYARGTLYVADTNSHLIRTVNLKSGEVGTLTIAGLVPPGAETKVIGPRKPTFPGAAQVKLPAATVKAEGGQVKFAVDVKLPLGWKANAEAPASYFPEAVSESGPFDRAALGKVVKLTKSTAAFDFTLPASGSGEDTVRVSLNYYYCQEKDEGVCKVGTVVWTIPLKIATDAKTDVVKLKHTAPD